jgi:hypothetical protein
MEMKGHFPIASKKMMLLRPLQSMSFTASSDSQVMNLPLKFAINVCLSGGERLQER